MSVSDKKNLVQKVEKKKTNAINKGALTS